MIDSRARITTLFMKLDSHSPSYVDGVVTFWTNVNFVSNLLKFMMRKKCSTCPTHSNYAAQHRKNLLKIRIKKEINTTFKKI